MPLEIPAMAERVPATESTKSDSQSKLLVPRNDIPGLGNFAQISAHLFRGEQPTKEGVAALKKMEVRTIISLRSYHSDRRVLKGSGLQYVHLRCKAWQPNDTFIAQFIKLLRESAHRPVFVHCQHGADRTGMMVAAYRIIEQGWNVADAARETHNFGFQARCLRRLKSTSKNLSRSRFSKKFRARNCRE